MLKWSERCHDKVAFLPGGCLRFIRHHRTPPSDNASSTLRSPDLEEHRVVACSCQVRARCAHIKVTEKASTTLYSYVQLVRTCRTLRSTVQAAQDDPTEWRPIEET